MKKSSRKINQKLISNDVDRPKTLLALWLSFALIMVAYYLFWSDFFPNKFDGLGRDYHYVIMRLLAGSHWFEVNGLWSLPYFTPAYCAGDVFFTDPQNNYFSLPQFLTFVLSPLWAIKWTIALFLVIGFLGFFILLKRIFKLSTAVSFLGAALFFFNDFFIYRMVIGHLTFHGFMLLPWVSALLLWQSNHLKSQLFFTLLAASLFSYVFYSGAVHLLIPMFIAIISIILIAKIAGIDIGRIKLKLSLFVVFVLLLSAAKLSMALATLSVIPRDFYDLVAIKSFFNIFWFPFKSLFLSVLTEKESRNLIINNLYPLSRHEYQMGVSIVPLIIISIGLYFKRHAIKTRLLQHKMLSLLLLALLLISIFVNYGAPVWYSFLQQLPIVKNSYTLFRWYSVYIPIVILVAMLLLNRWHLKSKEQYWVVVLLLLAAFLQKISVDNTFYHHENYPINQTLLNTELTPIQYVASSITVDKKVMTDEVQMMAYGVSKTNCYEPFFGYLLENFPQREKLFSQTSLTIRLDKGEYNFKNPACYTFDKANNCRAGDHFLATQKQQLENFLHYKPYQFKLPTHQKVLNYLTLLAWLLVFAIIIGSTLNYGIKKYISRRQSI